MHRHLSSTLVASSSLALLLLSNLSFAEPSTQQSAERDLLETGPAQSQYLYAAGRQPSALPRAELPIAQELHVRWILSRPASLDKQLVPGLRF